MAYYPYIKQQMQTISYEDTKNCFHSLDYHVRKIDKILENFVQDLGSDHRWMVYDIQTKLSDIHTNNKRFWVKKGSEEDYIKLREKLLDAVELLYSEAEKYKELRTWINKNSEN